MTNQSLSRSIFAFDYIPVFIVCYKSCKPYLALKRVLLRQADDEESCIESRLGSQPSSPEGPVFWC